VPASGIDPPQMTIRVWQAAPQAKPATGLDAAPKTPPRVVLQIGHADALRKLVYARLEGDPSLLAIPDTFLGALPRSPLAFRNRTVLTLSPTEIHRLTIHRDGTTFELVAPTEPGKSTRWRMVRPIEARADEESVTKALVLLSNLHAEDYVS